MVGVRQTRVSEVLSVNETFRLPIKLGQFDDIKNDKDRLDAIEKENQENASHLTDFDPPIYNIWKQQEKTSGSAHFGNSEVRWVDNLLYLYTNPFDIVIDPFGGGQTHTATWIHGKTFL